MVTTIEQNTPTKLRELFDYQAKFVDEYTKYYRTALFWQMRLGKSITYLRWLRSKRIQPKRNLIICPKTVKVSWAEELKKEHIDFIDLDSQALHRPIIEYIKDKPITVLTHYEFITRGEDNGEDWKTGEWKAAPNNICSLPWDSVCIDEATKIRNPLTKTAKIFWDYESSFPLNTDYWQSEQKHQYRAVLTGTPAPEGYLDYFCYFKFLYNGIILNGQPFHRYADFKNTCFYQNWDNQLEMYPTYKPHLAQYLKNKSHSLTRKAVKIDLPNTYQKRYVSLPVEHQAIYNDFEENFYTEFFDYIRNNLGILEEKSILQLETEFATAARSYLHQLSVGFPKDKPIAWTHKLKELQQIINAELEPQKVVIWSQYRRPLDVLKRTFPKCGVIQGGMSNRDVASILERCRLPLEDPHAINLLACQARKASMGMDLSFADTQIRLANSDSSLDYEQSLDRLVHPTKINKKDFAGILTIEIITENTIDQDMHERLVHKKGRQSLMQLFLARTKKAFDIPKKTGLQHEN